MFTFHLKASLILGGIGGAVFGSVTSKQEGSRFESSEMSLGGEQPVLTSGVNCFVMSG